jgi:hypothetical protein
MKVCVDSASDQDVCSSVGLRASVVRPIASLYLSVSCVSNRLNESKFCHSNYK